MSYLCSARTPKPLNNAQIGGRFIFIPLWDYCSTSLLCSLMIWLSCFDIEGWKSRPLREFPIIYATIGTPFRISHDWHPCHGIPNRQLARRAIVEHPMTRSSVLYLHQMTVIVLSLCLLLWIVNRATTKYKDSLFTYYLNYGCDTIRISYRYMHKSPCMSIPSLWTEIRKLWTDIRRLRTEI